MDELVDCGQLSAWAPRAFKAFARDTPSTRSAQRGLPWTEIDTPEDYRHALEHVYPAIRDAIDRSTRMAVGA